MDIDKVNGESPEISGLHGVLKVITEAAFFDSRWRVGEISPKPRGYTIELDWFEPYPKAQGTITINITEASETPKREPVTHKDRAGDIWTRQSDGSYRYGESVRRNSLDDVIDEFGVYQP